MELDISLAPTRGLGYFCGLTFGDGWIQKTKSRNYEICLESTKKDIVKIFYDSARSLGMNPFIRSYEKKRTLPNGEKRKDLHHKCISNSKKLFSAMHPFKGKGYWRIPDFLSTEESLWGFAGGFTDAEGHVLGCGVGIGISNKCVKGLKQLKKVLEDLGLMLGKLNIIQLNKGIYRLAICGYNIGIFLEKAELRLKRQFLEEAIISPSASKYITREDLQREYWDNEKSIREVGEFFGKLPCQIRRWMIRYGIPRRSLSEANQLQWDKRREVK